MAQNGINVVCSNSINGVQCNAPLNWKGIKVKATFDNDNYIANISTSQLEFTGLAAKIIRQWFSDGKCFLRLPYILNLSNNTTEYIGFDGYIDFTQGYEDDVVNNIVKVTIVKKDGLNQLDDRIAPLSFSYLENAGVFTDADYVTTQIVVEKPINIVEQLTNSVMVYLIAKETYESIQKTGEFIVETSAYIVTSFSGGVAATINSLGKKLLQLAYTIALITALTKLGVKMIRSFKPPIRDSKCISYRTALTKIFGYLGYTLQTNITDLDNMFYLPPNNRFEEVDDLGFPKIKGTRKGIPSTSDDFGYWIKDFMQIVKGLFNPRYTIKDGVIYMYNEYDDFWNQKSKYKLPSTLPLPNTYNFDEFSKSREIRFVTDSSNDWTLELYKGTTYVISTNDTTGTIDNNMKGFDEIVINMSLPSRKNILNPLEQTVSGLAQLMDNLINTLGGKSKLKEQVTSKLGIIKTSGYNWKNPYLLYLNGNRLPVNHRDLTSAKYFYEKYHFGKSFVANNFYGQKLMIKNKPIPFGFNDFLTVINNSLCTTFDNKDAKITEFEWTIGEDIAEISGYIREPYCTLLSENKSEQE